MPSRKAIINDTFERRSTNIPVFTLSGNHDMYCGGVGFYDLIGRLNQPPTTQSASFFCLRTADQSWQLLAMDTGLHDYNPFSVGNSMTFIEADEEEWHFQRLAEFSGKTILLSHHQLFSAFSEIGKPDVNGKLIAYNPLLQATFERFRQAGSEIAAWFWGHEHSLCIYEPYKGLRRGRCLGNSAIPVFIKDEPYKVLGQIDEVPRLITGTDAITADFIYANAFATISLGHRERGARTDYFQSLNGRSLKTYSEEL